MMKRMSNQFFLYSLTSLAVTASSLAYAQEDAQAPSLEGGITASIGTFYAAPTGGNQDYAQVLVNTDDFDTFRNTQIAEVTPDYDFGFAASLGYVFEDTANSVELSYRGFDSDDNNDSVEFIDEVYAPVFNDFYDIATSSLSYQFNAVDLMFNQFLDIGTHVQVRFAAGASYVNLEKNQTNTYFFDVISEGGDDYDQVKNHSEFDGFGPRAGIDGRYDFGENLEGFGIVAGGSLAYYVGDMDVTSAITCFDMDDTSCSDTGTFIATNTDDVDNHGVTNLRANVGIDYVYFFENEESTLGIELGYLIDYYADAISDITYQDGFEDKIFNTELNSFSYSGPYVNLKGVF